MKKTKFIWGFLPLFLTGIMTTNFINFSGVNINESETKNNSTSDINIINDINSNYWIKNNKIETKIKLSVRTIKELWIFSSIRANHRIWYQDYQYKDVSTPTFDTNSKNIHFNVWNKPVSQLFSDPDPYWADPSGAKWNNKLVDIGIEGKKGEHLASSKNYWYGKSYYNDFILNDQNVYKPQNYPFYPWHNYFAYTIRYYQTPSYVHQALNKKIEFSEITNKNFFNTFIELNKISFDNNGKVWNKDNYNQMDNLIKFNDSFHIAREISKVYQVVEKIDNFIIANTSENDQWLNQIVKKENILSLKNDFENWKFASANEALVRYNALIDINNSELIPTTSNYESEYNKLIENIYKNKLISLDRQLTIFDIDTIYKITLAIFKQNQINLTLNINDKFIKYNIWDGESFIKIWNDLLLINKDNNLLKIGIEKVEFKYIGDHNKTGYFNSSYTIENSDISNELKKEISLSIREEANNFDNVDVLNINNFGIQIDSDLYLSETLGTGKNIGNGYPYGEFIPDKKNTIKNLLNSNFILPNKKSLFNEIYDISNSTNILNYFDNRKTYEAFQSFNININGYPNFIPKNENGDFYLIGETDKWKFSDGTNGDFTENFKNNFFEKANINSLNIIELEPKDRLISGIWDDNGYFLIKCKNNLVKELNININNDETILVQIEKFINYLKEQKNWIPRSEKIVEDYFLYQKEYKKVLYSIGYNELSEEEINYLTKDLKVEVEISNENLYMPIDFKYGLNDLNRYNTFFKYFFETPIWKYIESYYANFYNVELVDEITFINENNIEEKKVTPNEMFFKYFDIIEKNNYVTIFDKNDLQSKNIIKIFIPVKELSTSGELSIQNNSHLIDLKINEMNHINTEVTKYNKKNSDDYYINLNYWNIFTIVGPIVAIGIIVLTIFLIKKWRNRFETKLTKLTDKDISLD